MELHADELTRSIRICSLARIHPPCVRLDVDSAGKGEPWKCYPSSGQLSDALLVGRVKWTACRKRPGIARISRETQSDSYAEGAQSDAYRIIHGRGKNGRELL